MKLVQLNLWQGKLLQPAIRFLQEEQPDFICLQEVHSSQLTQPLIGQFSSLEQIKAAFPGYHGYYSPTWGMAMVSTTVTMGNAILSRYPLAEARTVFIHGNYARRERSADFETGRNTRNLQVVRAQLDGQKSVTIANHHGYWEENPAGTEITRAKLQQVAGELAKESEPLILAGDLNVSYASPVMEPLQTVYYDLIGEHKVKTTLSILSSVPVDVACDHIMVSEEVRAHKLIVCDDVLVSDHLPIMLEFDI